MQNDNYKTSSAGCPGTEVPVVKNSGAGVVASEILADCEKWELPERAIYCCDLPADDVEYYNCSACYAGENCPYIEEMTWRWEENERRAEEEFIASLNFFSRLLYRVYCWFHR